MVNSSIMKRIARHRIGDTELLSRRYTEKYHGLAQCDLLHTRVIQDCITRLFNQSPSSIYIDQMIKLGISGYLSSCG